MSDNHKYKKSRIQYLMQADWGSANYPMDFGFR